MRKITVLETTLRDGSYATNYSFTASDTQIICKGLEEAGFEYIEIGHGVGLNASNRGLGQAAASDEEYMRAARSALKKAKYGMFCIPGIARLEDLDVAAEHAMAFVRVGTEVSEVKTSEAFMKKAKEHGMFAAANYMKSYAVSPGQFAEQVKLSESYGADMIYIVDSAGGMFPEDIRKYYEAVRNVSSIPIGFHGHDNLGMAVSNSLEAALSGAHFVDSSLQGLGRSAGNASTEQLVLSLLKKGFDVGVDFIRVLKLGEKYIQPRLPNKGKMPLDLISGFADFHSSYMHHIEQASSKHNVDPARLIIEMCKIDKVNLDVHVLEEVATKMRTGAPNFSTQGDTYMTRGIAEIAAERSQAMSPHISSSIADDGEEIRQVAAVVG